MTDQLSRANVATPQSIDLMHLARPGVVGAWRMGEVIVDPGPSSCLQTLLPALEADPPRVLALTHIHLDHAGATGSLLRRFPDAEVWVHERGAPHLVDPSKLLASATRLYGEWMDVLWGEVLPVPSERLRVLRGGETIGPFRVAYTPGHASHHVSYLHEPSGCAFVGDVAGVRIADGPVLAPTPPPDIDLPAWRDSLDVVEAWRPSSLAITHFGCWQTPDAHLAELRAHLDWVERLAGELDEDGFIAAIHAHVAAVASPETAAFYEQATSPGQNFHGLARYLTKRERLGALRSAD
jgi:glyoxylase-like metal-dependent hydrolase (beta-lactamase superfamily II)